MPDLSGDTADRKRDLRARLRFRRRHFVDNLDAMARLAAFRALPEGLADRLARDSDVSAYIARAGEADILPALSIWLDRGRVAMPYHAERDAIMGFRRWHADDPLEQGPWRTAQPLRGAPAVVPDLIFCPLLGFDRAGRRLGQGGGHYDRYFAAHPDSLRIGVAWSIQEVDSIPTEATDIPLDAILTEQEWLITGDRM
ncbi:MAG: 5-formyltetrahydrofolate cyclo-ligase [Sphingopyxis macrogoltabida]|uniref:5-formyltetrahydrofolate cyclo-ligase n=1 Tax=Sphingopyxis macrogoltabida TaxID=33050 RepID=A0A2W5MQC2_SPHMC|nr:MAG: 5-formyltetrahydrofolate cyclo-ligase [Sphingopyxis macrogoltabida]